VSGMADYLGVEKILDVLVGSGKFLDITKPAHIMDAIPREIDYQYGETLMLWLVAPIPRSVWLSKPVIAIAATIGELVYHVTDTSGLGQGIPPTYIGELYWNLDVPGVLVGMFLLGAGLRFLYANMKEQLTYNKSAMVIYISIMLPCVNLLQNSFALFILDSAKQIIPLVAALYFIGRTRTEQ
jgi:hypothetical protein